MTEEQDAGAGSGTPDDTPDEATAERAGRPGPLSEIQGFVEDMFENIRTFGPTVPGRHPRTENENVVVVFLRPRAARHPASMSGW